jgi:archaellum component FlaC
MTHYKPYSPEWHRYRNLRDSIESYLNEYVDSDVICGDILDILEDRRTDAENEIGRMTSMIDHLSK